MMNARVILLVFCLGGCAGSFDAVKGAAGNAPDWYGERRAEIRGEGYPDISAVPQPTDNREQTKRIKASQREVAADERAFLNDPRSQPPTETPADILAFAEDLAAKIITPEPSGHLTDAEVKALQRDAIKRR